MNAQHSSGNDGWLTPLWLLQRVREVLGEIDLDPASSFEANKRVKAKLICTELMDGLTHHWGGSIFINPPGGVRYVIGKKKRSNQVLFWEKLMSERNIKHAIFLAFSLESLQSTQRCEARAMASFPLCIPNRRIRFDNPDGTPGKSPTHANAIIYVPGSVDCTDAFYDSFQDVGALLSQAPPPRVRIYSTDPEQEARNIEELRKQGYSV